jgi:hypothetical protein
MGWKKQSRKDGEEWNTERLHHTWDILCGLIIALDTRNIDGLNIYLRVVCLYVVPVVTDSHNELYCTNLKHSDVKI